MRTATGAAPSSGVLFVGCRLFVAACGCSYFCKFANCQIVKLPIPTCSLGARCPADGNKGPRPAAGVIRWLLDVRCCMWMLNGNVQIGVAMVLLSSVRTQAPGTYLASLYKSSRVPRGVPSATSISRSRRASAVGCGLWMCNVQPTLL